MSGKCSVEEGCAQNSSIIKWKWFIQDNATCERQAKDLNIKDEVLDQISRVGELLLNQHSRILCWNWVLQAKRRASHQGWGIVRREIRKAWLKFGWRGSLSGWNLALKIEGPSQCETELMVEGKGGQAPHHSSLELWGIRVLNLNMAF